MNMKSPATGFLVVLKTPECRGERGSRLNPQYSGVNRVPLYPPPNAEEASALDEYVFGDIKSNETNLIPYFGTALTLLKKLSSSPRAFEVIYCGTGPEDPILDELAVEKVVALGYDVAGVTGDGWSIVGDFASGEWAVAFANRLNSYGLFRDRADAQAYLKGYEDHNEPDSDIPFDVVYVARMIADRDAAPVSITP